MNPLDFKAAKVWQFSGREIKKATNGTEVDRHESVGIIAMSFDAAYATLREKRPNFRIENAGMSSSRIQYIVDDPRVVEVINRLTDNPS